MSWDAAKSFIESTAKDLELKGRWADARGLRGVAKFSLSAGYLLAEDYEADLY